MADKAWWCKAVIRAIEEAEAGGLHLQDILQQLGATLPKYKNWKSIWWFYVTVAEKLPSMHADLASLEQRANENTYLVSK